MACDDYFDAITRKWPEAGKSPTKELVDLCLAAVAEYPEESTFWYDLGIIMRRCGDEYGYTPEDYLHSFENAVKCNSMNAEAYQELGYVLDVFFDDYCRAEQAFRRAIELGATHESYYGLARVLAQIGKRDDAIAILSESVCPCHAHPDIQSIRAEILDGDWYWWDDKRE
jgi:tetratricopeptide (TPR) repeat protein